MKAAVVSGITGAYLTQCLLDKGYLVHPTRRRKSSVNFWRIAELGIRQQPNLRLVEYDLTDTVSSLNLITRTQPDEVYNLTAQSLISVPFGSLAERSLRWVLAELKAITGHDPTLRVALQLVRPTEVQRLIGSNRRLIQIVGEPPFHNFAAMLHAMVGHLTSLGPARA